MGRKGGNEWGKEGVGVGRGLWGGEVRGRAKIYCVSVMGIQMEGRRWKVEGGRGKGEGGTGKGERGRGNGERGTGDGMCVMCMIKERGFW